eukprot:g29136.t1
MRGDRDVRMEDLVRLRCDLRRYLSRQFQQLTSYFDGEVGNPLRQEPSSSECGGTWTKMETFLEQGSRSTHDAQIFATLPVEVEGGRSQRRLSRLAAASGSVLAAFQGWVAVSRITHEVVQQQDWAMSTYGPLRCLARDWHGEKLWLCSERHAFERMRVLCAHGDYLFRKDLEIDAARKFAEATAVPFEHVCLRFLGADRKAGLLEYLRLRLRRAGDQVTRSLLSVWAVEIALARLDELRCTEAAQSLAAERQQLLELLQQCTELDVHATIYHLLQSHGWLDELDTRFQPIRPTDGMRSPMPLNVLLIEASFAEMRKDFTTVILHHVSRREGTNAIRKLQHFGASAGQDLVCNFAPVLFGSAPAAFTSLLLKQPSLDPLLVLPGVYSPQGMPTHRTEAIRYLEHARSGWASGTALLNALVVMFADGGEETGTDGDAEEALLRFLQAQDSECVFESASREGWRGWVGGKGRDVSFVARDVAKKRLERQN